ncbi:MAG: hypothetical protein AB8G15_14560 [Saprospiraceae bacterium]
MLRKILWQQKSKWQIIGAAAGTFIGLLLLLVAFQIYLDLQGLLNYEGNNSNQYILINKKVNLFNTLGIKSNFTDEEIATITAMPDVNEVGAFSSNLFKVSASSRSLGFYTELFFEAVPDKFMDIDPALWDWQVGQSALPIVLSRDYLALYNFGFAPSQGLPQFTPSTIGKVSMDVTIKGKGKSKILRGRIVGFSDRINSVLVPQNFMEWANQNYGDTQKDGASRIILAMNNPNSKSFESFLKKNNYEVSNGRLIGSQLTTLLQSVISIVAIIGVLIIFLSILIFLLNFQLLISQSSEDIKRLLQLGYQDTQISGVLTKYLSGFFGIIVVLTIISLYLCRYYWLNWFSQQGFQLATGIHGFVFLSLAGFAVLFLALNIYNIRKNVIRLF